MARSVVTVVAAVRYGTKARLTAFIDQQQVRRVELLAEQYAEHPHWDPAVAPELTRAEAAAGLDLSWTRRGCSAASPSSVTRDLPGDRAAIAEEAAGGCAVRKGGGPHDAGRSVSHGASA